MEDVRLIYIHRVGKDSNNNSVFEFIFKRNHLDVDYKECNWHLIPASEHATPPPIEMDDIVKRLLVDDEYEFSLLEDSEEIPYVAGIHSIHCLGNELVEEYIIEDHYMDEQYTPLVFLYGQTLKEIEDKLLWKNLEFTK